ncbi:MAG: alpha/beta hydrolase [Sphingobacteriales bacterium]|nr:MAG: alpha/beta hydrolase [Sphingobacteriales bacterium]
MRSYTIQSAISSNLHFRKSGEGPVVMLLHGFPSNGQLWEDTGNRLSSRFTVIIPDIPGSGSSTLDKEDVSLEDMAHALKEICVSAGIEKLVVVGHSMGGYISLAFHELFPDLVAGLSLVHSSASADNDEKKETRRKSIRLIENGGKRPFVEQMIPALFDEGFARENPGLVKRQIAEGMQLSERSMVAFYKAMINRPDRTSNLPGATIPVQWIIGESDKVIPVSTAMEQCQLASVNFVSVYQNTGHMSMLEKPDTLYGDLEKFIEHCF